MHWTVDPANAAMIRKFLLVEVMLPGVSGEVGGEVAVNEWTGGVDHVDCGHFDFWSDVLDQPVVLREDQRALAAEVVRKTLEADCELSESTAAYRGSARMFDRGATSLATDSQRVLADHLQNVRRVDAGDQPANLQIRRSG